MLNVVFENDSFLAVDKPAGWLSVPSRDGIRDTRACVSVEARKLCAAVLPVHRLDQEVSGLLLLAKTREAHRVANGWFESRAVHKIYEAWSEGVRAEQPGPQLWESLLVRGKKRTFEAEHGKPSATRATWLGSRVLEGGTEFQQWRLEPLTGRSHQLRFELAKRGYPILGDLLYGAKKPWRENEIALRAVRLEFAEAPEAAAYGLPAALDVKGLADG